MTSRILIAGGSLGGLLAANLLLRAGHDVTVLEKVAGSLDGRGAGIVTHSGLITAMRQGGALVDEDSLGVRVQQRRVLDASGEVSGSCDYPQVLTSWSRLHALMSEAFPAERCLAGRAVEQVEQDAQGVRVRCANGAWFEGDLLIAADGLRSAVRAQLAPDVHTHYAGYVAWRGLCDEALLSPHTRSTLFEYFAVGLPRGEQMIGYPVAGPGNTTEHGRRRFNFVWYRPADQAVGLRRLLTDEQGLHHEGGIPPQRVHPQEVAAMRRDAQALLAPQFAEVLAKTEQPFLQPIYDLQSQRTHFGRVALVGDAAFVARPHVGMGVTKAAADALALRDAIDQLGVTPAALQAFERLRLQPGQQAVERGRRLGAYMQAQGGSAAERGAAEAGRDAAHVMRETAIDPVHLVENHRT